MEISGGVVTSRECDVLLACLIDEGLIKSKPFEGSEDGFCAVGGGVRLD